MCLEIGIVRSTAQWIQNLCCRVTKNLVNSNGVAQERIVGAIWTQLVCNARNIHRRATICAAADEKKGDMRYYVAGLTALMIPTPTLNCLDSWLQLVAHICVIFVNSTLAYIASPSRQPTALRSLGLI